MTRQYEDDELAEQLRLAFIRVCVMRLDGENMASNPGSTNRIFTDMVAEALVKVLRIYSLAERNHKFNLGPITNEYIDQIVNNDR